eukprot:snap_masked-scaffold_42-processed-gene-1.19-mRNA-1 protein AED:0.16 eAED:0.20 QI:0/0/0/0.66/1/1/3/0/434
MSQEILSQREITIEVCVKPCFNIEEYGRRLLQEIDEFVASTVSEYHALMRINIVEKKKLFEVVEFLKVAEFDIDPEPELECIGDAKQASLKSWEVRRKYLIYSLGNQNGYEDGLLQVDDEMEKASAFKQFEMPCIFFFFHLLQVTSLWENLFFDGGLKSRLCKHVETSLLFSQKKVDQNAVSWNNMVLLHGPPGTAKTSLCKAFAHHLSKALCSYTFCPEAEFKENQYTKAKFLEINSHSLFSKWFSESGKLVTKLFQYVRELCQNKSTLVCLLVDEVETLAGSRVSAGSSEPTDAIRVVNALLTQLDSLKYFSNVVIMTTSNLTNAIDTAFIDRADLCEYVGLPSFKARQTIFKAALQELRSSRLIFGDFLKLSVRTTMKELCNTSEGLSGRSLKKIPLKAYCMCSARPSSVECLITSMIQVAKKEKTKLLSK